MVSGTANRRLLPLVLITGMTLLALDAAGFGPINALRRTVLTTGAPVRSVLVTAASPVTSLWHGAVDYDDVVEENRRLRYRLAEAEGALASQPDLAAELAALSAAVDVSSVIDLERVTARVVADRRTALERIVELDKGSDDGLAPGMPVLTGAGLVGVIDEVVPNRSVVRLLTDPETAVGVRSRHGVGLIVGRGGSRIELDPGPDLAAAIDRGQVADGHRLLTSGLERSHFPAGIPVAVLELPDGGGADRSDAGVRGELVAVPGADLDNLGYLTVLLVDRPA